MRKATLYQKGSLNLLFIFGFIFIIVLCVQLIKDEKWFGAICLIFLELIGLLYFLFTPQSIYLKKNTITEKYLFQEKSFNANDIISISVNRRAVNFGRGPRSQTFIDIETTNGYKISIEYIQYRTPDIYKIIQGWHKKYGLKTHQTIAKTKIDS